MSALAKQLQMPSKKDIFKGFSDEYLKKCVDEAMITLKTQKAEDGEVVFKRQCAKFEKKYGKLPE